jgi:hypothetical protein
MPQCDIATVKEAVAVAGVSDETIYAWIERHKIGRRRGGWAWQVSLPGVLMVMDRKRVDYDALDALMAGDRQNFAVVDYIERAKMLLHIVRNLEVVGRPLEDADRVARAG